MSRALPTFPLVASIAIGSSVGLLVLVNRQLPWWAAPIAVVIVSTLVFLIWTRRDRRRRALSKQPFPEGWRAILQEWVSFYRELEDDERRRFENEVRIFMAEQTISGPRGAEIDDELKVLVAASAVVIVFGRQGFHYPPLRDVVVYPEAFDDEYRIDSKAHILGMVHAQGPILFSARSLKQGFRGEHDGRNVGYHEFAHVLDFDSGRADGVPSMLPWNAIRPWLTVMHSETQKAGTRASVLRGYAKTNEAEFFAVASEMFFERPRSLAEKHPELYELLKVTYGQDPATEHSERASRGGQAQR